MDHPCHKCGHNVEDGKAFCSQCGAPQIRVVLTEPASVGSVAITQPAFDSNPPDLSDALHNSAISNEIDWRRAFWWCAAAAALSLLFLRVIGPIFAMIGAGALAVAMYYRRRLTRRASAASGAKIGAVVGLLSSGVLGLCFSLTASLLRAGGETQQQMMAALQQFASRAGDPEVQATLDRLNTPEGLNKMVWVMLAFCMFSIVAASLAGALTGALLGRRKGP